MTTFDEKSNGHANGHTNGRINGHANGHANGHLKERSGHGVEVKPAVPFRMDPNAPRTRGFYVAGAVALLVYSVTPISWLTVLIQYSRKGTIFALPTNNGFAKFWYCLSFAEVFFSIYFQYLIWKGSRKPPPPKIDRQVLSQLLTKCLMVGLTKKQSEDNEDIELSGLSALQTRQVNQEDATLLRERLRVWFHHAPMDDIYADNIREWLSWAFTGRGLDEVRADAEMTKLIDEGLEMIKHRLDWPDIKPGYNPKIKALRLTLDSMKVLNRPLGYYVVCNGVSHGVILWLRLCRGFHYEYSGKCSFLVKPPVPDSQRKSKKEKRGLSILFMHGLGIGIGQYMAFLAQLSKYEDGVMILYQPHISADITHPYFLNPPNKDEQAEATYAILQKHNMPKVTTLSHSNGTMVLGWLIRRHPEICARNILVDPVSFRLWEGSVCYSFVYRRWQTFIEVLLGYFVARELGTARTIGRNFQWSDMCLWVEDFPQMDKDNLHIIFGEVDLLVDVPSCVTYLEESGVPDECITVVPNYQHGKALMFKGDGMELVLKQLGISSSSS